jgi:2-polyprenyl-6-methoxyphenol hydroxylase-like FAD-dependent oxidoreductase
MKFFLGLMVTKSLIGDACHAIAFYGQGMNAGFEDISILYMK